MLVAVLATLASVLLFYLSDRQQRWLDQPLPVFTRVIALALLAGYAAYLAYLVSNA